MASLLEIPNTKYLVSGCGDSTIKLWNYESGQCISTLNGHSNYILSLVYIPNTKYIASSSYDDTIKIWNYETC